MSSNFTCNWEVVVASCSVLQVPEVNSEVD